MHSGKPTSCVSGTRAASVVQPLQIWSAWLKLGCGATLVAMASARGHCRDGVGGRGESVDGMLKVMALIAHTGWRERRASEAHASSNTADNQVRTPGGGSDDCAC